jgi:hypothetical protein
MHRQAIRREAAAAVGALRATGGALGAVSLAAASVAALGRINGHGCRVTGQLYLRHLRLLLSRRRSRRQLPVWRS